MMKLPSSLSEISVRSSLKKSFRRIVPIAIGCVATLLLLLWAWYQLKAILFGAAGIAILVGAYAIKKRLS